MDFVTLDDNCWLRVRVYLRDLSACHILAWSQPLHGPFLSDVIRSCPHEYVCMTARPDDVGRRVTRTFPDATTSASHGSLFPPTSRVGRACRGSKGDITAAAVQGRGSVRAGRGGPDTPGLCMRRYCCGYEQTLGKTKMVHRSYECGQMMAQMWARRGITGLRI